MLNLIYNVGKQNAVDCFLFIDILFFIQTSMAKPSTVEHCCSLFIVVTAFFAFLQARKRFGGSEKRPCVAT
jgi:hypothetical protein